MIVNKAKLISMRLVLFLININIIRLVSKGHERKEVTENN